MSDLTAIDILLEPDASMLDRADRENTRMLSSVPSPPGFHLDENHRPHITTLQRYVRTGDLDKVYAAIQSVLDAHDLGGLRFTAQAIRHMEVQPSVALAAIVVKPGPEVLEFQSRLIDAVKPFCESVGRRTRSSAPTPNPTSTTRPSPTSATTSLITAERTTSHTSRSVSRRSMT